MKITAIIPLRITEHVYQGAERLHQIIKNIPASKFNVLIVDYGTPLRYRSALEGIHASHVSIVRKETEGSIFSIGHARDLGVQYAKDPVVMFHDVDFFCTSEMYGRIHSEVVARGMDKNAYDFFCVPVFFLSEQGSELALKLASEGLVGDHQLHRHLYENSSGVVEFPAYGSSAIVVNKAHYLGLGGHSREFYGHGAEDYDILHRLSAYYPKGPRPADYYVDTKSNQTAHYRGFRAFFALYGLDVFAKGIFLVHLWHPKRSIPGYHQSNRNFGLLADLMRRFDRSFDQPAPLPDLSVDRRGLALVRHDSSTFKAIRHVLPALGDVNVLPEDDFGNAEELLAYCRRHRIDRVLFLNPYGNSHRLGLYQGVREAGIEYFVFDRGALPNSWFFDPNGFNFDSESYSADRWDVPLDEGQAEEVRQYIGNLRNGDDALEENGARRSGRYLREKYGIGKRKVLFVPFQRPSDTVTTHFAGAAGSVLAFQSWVAFLASRLSRSDWSVVCKNHPLDRDLPRVDGVTYVDDDVHIHDLLDLSDKVLLMNSGVGVLALAFSKPVICTANAFYAHHDMVWSADSMEAALSHVLADLRVDETRVERFYWHLLNRIYSFGTAKYRKTVADDGSERNMVQQILFESIRLPGVVSIGLGKPPRGVSLDAPLFSSFGGRAGVKAALEKKQTAVPKSSTAARPSPSATPKGVGATQAPGKPSIPKFERKVRKLLRDPKLFFLDLFRNRKLGVR